MPPPVALIQPDGLSGDTQSSAGATGLVEPRDILHDATVAFAKVVLLLVRIHRGAPYNIETYPRRVINESDSKAAKSLDYFDRQRTNCDFMNLRSQCPRRTEVVLLALMPDGGESVLHILIRILSDATSN